jgi:hypothetical protein
VNGGNRMREIGRVLTQQPRRYLGIELSGAKSARTAVAALEYYPREKKIFLLDIFDRITAGEDHTSDESLIDVLSEMGAGAAGIGANVPFQLPPCINCTRKTCPLPGKCTVPAVKWMRELKKRSHSRTSAQQGPRREDGTLSNRVARGRDFTPYTQRPIELHIRHKVLDEIPEGARFDIDETLGGSRAALTARMHFLSRHLPAGVPCFEAWPKLTVAVLAEDLDLSKRTLGSWRKPEEGIHARSDILERVADHLGVFIYERDLRKLSQSISSFDAFLCALTAQLADTGRCVRPPAGFPAASGWVHYPQGGAP